MASQEQHNDRILTLIERTRAGIASEEEILEIDAWYNAYEQTEGPLYTDGMSRLDRVLAKEKLLKYIRRQIDREREITRFRPRQGYAFYSMVAITLMVMAVSVYFYNRRNQDLAGKQLSSSQTSDPNVDWLHQSGQATLKLADGRKVNLDKSAGIVIRPDKISYSDGRPVTPVKRNSLSASSYELNTPKGGQYNITLSDGSKVYLNAASILKYPSLFAGDTREVELEGEAYFEVKHAPGLPPFIVKAGSQRTVVMGTDFNISAHQNEDIKTTLVSGAVRVCLTGDNGSFQKVKPVLLEPGEETIYHKGDTALVRQKANLSSSLAWKNGKFSFDDKSFVQVMKEFERWYNIAIVYEGPVPSGSFVGRANRSTDPALVLRLLESANLKYRVQGNRITIVNESLERRLP